MRAVSKYKWHRALTEVDPFEAGSGSPWRLSGHVMPCPSESIMMVSLGSMAARSCLITHPLLCLVSRAESGYPYGVCRAVACCGDRPCLSSRTSLDPRHVWPYPTRLAFFTVFCVAVTQDRKRRLQIYDCQWASRRRQAGTDYTCLGACITLQVNQGIQALNPLIHEHSR